MGERWKQWFEGRVEVTTHSERPQSVFSVIGHRVRHKGSVTTREGLSQQGFRDKEETEEIIRIRMIPNRPRKNFGCRLWVLATKIKRDVVVLRVSVKVAQKSTLGHSKSHIWTSTKLCCQRYTHDPSQPLLHPPPTSSCDINDHRDPTLPVTLSCSVGAIL